MPHGPNVAGGHRSPAWMPGRLRALPAMRAEAPRITRVLLHGRNGIAPAHATKPASIGGLRPALPSRDALPAPPQCANSTQYLYDVNRSELIRGSESRSPYSGVGGLPIDRWQVGTVGRARSDVIDVSVDSKSGGFGRRCRHSGTCRGTRRDKEAEHRCLRKATDTRLLSWGSGGAGRPPAVGGVRQTPA